MGQWYLTVNYYLQILCHGSQPTLVMGNDDAMMGKFHGFSWFYPLRHVSSLPPAAALQTGAELTASGMGKSSILLTLSTYQFEVELYYRETWTFMPLSLNLSQFGMELIQPCTVPTEVDRDISVKLMSLMGDLVKDPDSLDSRFTRFTRSPKMWWIRNGNR